MTLEQVMETRALHERALSLARKAPDGDPDYYCARCGEHSEGDILEVYMPEPVAGCPSDAESYWVAALHVDTCRPFYPWLVAED